MGRARELANGGINDVILMDASASDTDVNDNLLLNATDSSSTDAGFNLLYEEGTHDAAVTFPVGRDDLSLTGSIVQVKQGKQVSFITLTNSTSHATFADIFLEVDITPTSASNKILLLGSLSISSATADRLAFVKFIGGNTGVAGVQGSTAIGIRTPMHQAVHFDSAVAMANVSMQLLDSPATTDTIRYEVQVAPNYNSGDLGINFFLPNSSNQVYLPATTSTITAIEVAT